MTDRLDFCRAEPGSHSRDRSLTIGEFAKRTFLSPKALRLYDQQHILVPAEVDPDNRYRRYRESQIPDARLISHLRRLDMPLAVVSSILRVNASDRPQIVVDWWDETERRMAGKRELLIHLLIGLSGKERQFDMYEILEREVPEQAVVTEQRHVTQSGLTEWFDDCMPRLHTVADENGGIAGSAFIIYHGEVNEESDGPVEVCVPIQGERIGTLDAPTRIEPAHREAYTRITMSQLDFPAILEAYDAVEQWVATNNRQIVASPREVYFTDMMSANPDDEVCDIAFPIA